MHKIERRRPQRPLHFHCAECQDALRYLQDDSDPLAAVRALKQLASHGLEPDAYKRFCQLLADFVRG